MHHWSHQKMSYTAIIKEGFSVVNRAWQLALLHLLSAVISFISFFLIVGMPISIAFVVFGLDLTEILRSKDLVEVLRNSMGLLKKYFAMAIVIITSLLFYLTIIFTLWLFTISGSLGTLSKIITNEISRYSTKVFFAQGRKLFFPILGFSSLIGIILLLVAFFLGILGGGISSIIEIAQSQEAVLALFLGVFFSVIIFITGIVLIFIILSITVYGIADVIFNKTSPFKALKNTTKYLYNHPSSVGFYSILLIVSIMSIFFVILLGSPVILIPFLGPVLSPLFQIVSTIIQAYINLVVFASAFIFFYKTGYTPPPEVLEPISPVEENITQETDTSAQPTSEPDLSPQKKEGSGQK